MRIQNSPGTHISSSTYLFFHPKVQPRLKKNQSLKSRASQSTHLTTPNTLPSPPTYTCICTDIQPKTTNQLLTSRTNHSLSIHPPNQPQTYAHASHRLNLIHTFMLRRTHVFISHSIQLFILQFVHPSNHLFVFLNTQSPSQFKVC